MSSIEIFDWKTAKLNSFSFAIIASLSYLFIILGHQSYPEIRRIFFVQNTKFLVSIHNIILTLASLSIFVGCSYEVIKRTQAGVIYLAVNADYAYLITSYIIRQDFSFATIFYIQLSIHNHLPHA
jgi:hypothetical protein